MEKNYLTKWLNKSLHLASLPTVPEVIRQIGKARLFVSSLNYFADKSTWAITMKETHMY